ncbi:MAG: hypothetical protein ACFFE8_09585 [Candidatus Heimdallarchaeota archaeon]
MNILGRGFDFAWFPISRAQYRVTTSRIRGYRPYLPYIIPGGLALWIFVIAPMIVDSLIDEIQAIILSQVAVVMIQFLLTYFFLIFLTFPIVSTLQDIKADQLSLLLSSPVHSSDLLIGEFVGKSPFYTVFAVIIGGLFTAVLVPLNLDMVQILIVVLIFVVIFFSALWIGNLIAVILRSFLMKSARGRDIGRGLAVLIILPLVAILYGFMGGYLEALKDPAIGKLVQDILTFVPSAWGAGVIVEFARNPGDLSAIDPFAYLQFAGILVFFFGSVYLGGILANRAYNMEPSTFSASTAKPDGILYKSIKRLGVTDSFGTLLVSGFKNYMRNARNVSWAVYAIGLTAMVSLFLMTPTDHRGAIISTRILAPLLAAFVVSEVTLQGKENLLIYKQTPSGTSRYIMAKFWQYLLSIMPVVFVFDVIVGLRIAGMDGMMFGSNLVFSLMIASGTVTVVLGLFLMNPAYDDKAAEYQINLQICIFLLLIPFFIGMILLENFAYHTIGFLLSGFTERDAHFYSWILLYGLLIWLVGMIFLWLGKKRLENLE